MSHFPSVNPPATGFLVNLLTVNQRKVAYKAHQFVGFSLYVLTVVLVAMEQGLPPKWFLVVAAVYAAISPFFTVLADANAVPTGDEPGAVPPVSDDE